MKKNILLFAVLIISFNHKAQDNNIFEGHGYGFQLSQYQNDFGIGLQYNSPLLFKCVGIRVKYNFMFHEYIKDSLTTWSPYSNIGLGLIGFGGMVTSRIRIYGEGGLLLILPSSAFSSKKQEIGGYGVFGFEFFATQGFNYFIEIGGVGSGAIADKIPFKPIYSNGMSISTGFRVIFH